LRNVGSAQSGSAYPSSNPSSPNPPPPKRPRRSWPLPQSQTYVRVLYTVSVDSSREQAPEKLSARAERFGTGQKRPAPTEDVDPEEQEKRRKRAERFGTGAKDA
jgi:hypothetical protein